MSTTATQIPKPSNQLWVIDYTDREYARLLGDPLRTVIEAPTKQAAEETAGKLAFESPWAHPVTAAQVKQALWLPQNDQVLIDPLDRQTLCRSLLDLFPPWFALAGWAATAGGAGLRVCG